ncbi:hypothetical protein S13b_00035 [Klebsiella phage VLCpiS13b]|uniref:hypothetical protein n=1 Tax=Klebsiella phage VLCpiS13b TaxID=2874886 RepID=UPI00233F69A7|nr:hypothetical protein PRB92_gp35 [Klebsiella phage VLCpiS13b]UVX30612.1 hypothetical protein S13b_00035 [Klebsiella phage VLCpiS13b]
MKGLINGCNSVDWSSMSTKDIIDQMSKAVVEVAGAIDKGFTFLLTEKAYHEIRRYRYRKCRVKKGCGKFRYVAIGRSNISFRRQR